jgi:hypothetical protein
VTAALSTWKIAVLAALLGIGVFGAGAFRAAADTTTTSCTGDHCYLMACNDEGYGCVRINDAPPFYRDHYPPNIRYPDPTRMICDAFDDNCHYPSHNRAPGYYDSFGVWSDAP